MIIPKIYDDIINHSTHLLIAGATGSGKSVTIHGIITGLLLQQPRPLLAFIDLKKVEMLEYKRLYNLFAYADTAPAAMSLLSGIRSEMLSRYSTMTKKGFKKWPGQPLYIIIDEYAELLIDSRKKCIPLIQSIAQLGRAAGIHLILATQCPLAKIIPTEIKLNFDGLLALRTRSKQDSRNIIGVSGAECLPRYGYGLFLCPDLLSPLKVKLPMIDESSRNKLIKDLSL